MDFVRRFLDSFSVYMQTQVALKRLQWTLSGALYCLYCGQFKRNFPEFMEHLMILHKFHCNRCEARFTDEAQLSDHRAVHSCDASEITKRIAPKVEPELRKSKRKISQPVQLRMVPKRLQIRSDRQKFKCDVCPLVYLRQCYLDQHKLQFHSKIKKIPLQAKISSEVKSVKSRFKRKKTPNKEECEDLLCSVELNYSIGFDNDHDVTHNSDNDHDVTRNSDNDDWGAANVTEQSPRKEFSCSECDFVGSTRREMLSHKNREHKISSKPRRRVAYVGLEEAKTYIDGIPVYACNTCGKTFRSIYDFKRHLTIHTDEMPFTCHQCGKRFRALHNLTRHLNSVHEKIKRHECDICGFKFAERKACTDHRRLHTGEKPFICEVCGKAFPTHTSIYCHRRIHTDYRPHKCPHCDRSFRTRQRLNDHVRIHTGARPYTCHLCFKTFRVRNEQQRHIQTHNTEKPYGCQKCGASFTLKRYLKQHMRKHQYMNLDTMSTVNKDSQEDSTSLYIL